MEETVPETQGIKPLNYRLSSDCIQSLNQEQKE
jgi:hypothetical protein